jgi:hypothetical protein
MVVYDLAGKRVLSTDLGNVSTGSTNIPVNLSKLTQGTYLMQVIVGTNSATRKIIINK